MFVSLRLIFLNTEYCEQHILVSSQSLKEYAIFWAKKTYEINRKFYNYKKLMTLFQMGKSLQILQENLVNSNRLRSNVK